jgi:dihydrofolate synthase / folylpolyglutamate synthase
MDYAQAIKYLESYRSRGMKLGLDRVRILLAKLGDPQNSFRSIHIAGTNGKGSVAAMLSSVLTKAGYRTGLYTSPHLVDYPERLRVNEKEISKKRFAEAVDQVKKSAKGLEQLELTEFEMITATCFLLLQKEKAEVAVIEVGLGGRLDATNVVDPIISIITNIDYDHMDVLGNSLQSIAKEKAGIIKAGIPLITGEVRMKKVLQKICDEKGSLLIRSNNQRVDLIPLQGDHQKENTRTALMALRYLRSIGYKISDADIQRGLRFTKWPGRMQTIENKPLMIIDGAHNLAGAKALNKYLNSKYKKFTFIIGMQKNKDINSYIRTIRPNAKRFIVVRSSNPGAMDQKLLARKIGHNAEDVSDLKKAVSIAKRYHDPICVTGSLYLVGDFLKSINKIV